MASLTGRPRRELELDVEALDRLIIDCDALEAIALHGLRLDDGTVLEADEVHAEDIHEQGVALRDWRALCAVARDATPIQHKVDDPEQHA